MLSFMRMFERSIVALLMAASVVLLSAGIFAYAPRATDSGAPPTFQPGDPNFEPIPTPTDGALVTPSPLPTEPAGSVEPSDPSFEPVMPTPSLESPSTEPPPNDTPDPAASATPPAGQTPGPPRPGRAVATRIAVPAMNIDVPVVSGDLVVAGNRDNYPLCDVAQYLTSFSQPGESGTTYIYAHARTGMFLPLLTASQRNDGRSMIGNLVEVYTSDHRLHIYEIYIVKRHATDLALAHELPPAGHQLIMQTSEGPRGTVPKLQVAAKPLSIVPANAREANPNPRPRACR